MVEDSGNGIAEGDLAHVFEPFLAPSRKVWGWDSRSAGRSCKVTAGGFGLRTNVGSEVTVQVIGMHTLSPTVAQFLVEPNQPHGTRFLVFLPNERMT
jgi:hypothetical protein